MVVCVAGTALFVYCYGESLFELALVAIAGEVAVD